MENGVPVDVGEMRSHRKEGGPIRRAWRPDKRGASGHRRARGRGARHWPVCVAAASRGARGRREARGAPVPAPSRGAALRLRGLPVCGRDSPSARGGATSQLVTSEAHVQRRGPAAGDRAGGGRRGCPSEAASARVPMSRPAGSSSDARSSVSLLVRRRVLSSWWPSGSSTAKAPRAEGAAPAAVTGRVRGARGGGGGGSLSPSPGLRGSEARPAARQWKCCPFACFWAATM